LYYQIPIKTFCGRQSVNGLGGKLWKYELCGRNYLASSKNILGKTFAFKMKTISANRNWVFKYC